MKGRGLSSKTAFWLFILLAVYVFVQTTWWVFLMARLVAEKVDLAKQLNANQSIVDQIVAEEIRRQVMVGLEGVVFLVLICLGAWLIYRSLIKTRELTFHQQNFLMAVTHELKTPLASIKIYLDSLQSPKISNERKMAIIPKMGADLSRLEKLVENILDAGRFERSGYRLNRTNFNLSQMVTEALDMTSKVATHKPVTIERSIEAGIEIYGDRTALRRAISAVLENSLTYNDAGAVRIEARLTREGRRITLQVSDNGVGLEAGELKAVFNRFYRVGQELQRQHPGTGLGLYLCREIIRAHGGEITAKSAGPGKGTTFTIMMKANGDENDTARRG